MPGLSYLPNATNWNRLPRPEEFPAELRRLLRAVVHEARAAPRVALSAAFVEAPVLTSASGSVVTLLNWGGADFGADAPLMMNVSGLGFAPSRVASAEHGPLPFEVLLGVRHQGAADPADATVSVTLPLEAADFVSFFK
jgi:hypothetical protein